MPEGFWLGLTVGILSTVIGGLILAGVLYLFRRYWQNNPIRRSWDRWRAKRDAPRLLRAIRDRAERASSNPLNAKVSIDKAARQARVNNLAPALELLRVRGQIVYAEHGTNPYYVHLTAKGRDAENAG